VGLKNWPNIHLQFQAQNANFFLEGPYAKGTIQLLGLGTCTKPQSKHIIQLQAKLEALDETESQKMATGGCAQSLFHPPKNHVPAKVLRTTSSGKFFRCNYLICKLLLIAPQTKK
jgi:hypothetical protein